MVMDKSISQNSPDQLPEKKMGEIPILLQALDRINCDDKCKYNCPSCDYTCPKAEALVAEHDAKILKPISDVYEKFKHFDKIICDPLFMKNARDEGDYPRLFMYDMWSAITRTISKGEQ